MTRVIPGVDELVGLVGQELGCSEWQVVNQDAIDAFASATGDHQWIHVDPVRAASGPFGRTIAHGLLTAALIPSFVAQVYRLDGVSYGLNYGSNRIRFPSPLLVDSAVRARVSVAGVDEQDAVRVLVRLQVTVESDTSSKPVCVAEPVTLYFRTSVPAPAEPAASTGR